MCVVLVCTESTFDEMVANSEFIQIVVRARSSCRMFSEQRRARPTEKRTTTTSEFALNSALKCKCTYYYVHTKHSNNRFQLHNSKTRTEQISWKSYRNLFRITNEKNPPKALYFAYIGCYFSKGTQHTLNGTFVLLRCRWSLLLRAASIKRKMTQTNEEGKKHFIEITL